MPIEKCDEGGEGEVISPEKITLIDINSIPLIHNDDVRCTNKKCTVKMECKRFLQAEIDKNKSDFIYVEFPNIPAYTLDNPQESYDARKNCDKFIQHETNLITN